MFTFHQNNLKKILRNKTESPSLDWVKKYYDIIEKEELFIKSFDPVYGPDGLPYLHLFIDPTSIKTSLSKIADRCIENGFGAALFFKSPKEPEWVFSCGDFISLRNFGKILVEEGIQGYEKIIVKEKTEVTAGQPNESFLPKSIRNIIKETIQNYLNISEPKVLLMYNSKMEPKCSMVFNINKKDYSESEEKFYFVMQRIAWHLPKHCPATTYIKLDCEYFPL